MDVFFSNGAYPFTVSLYVFVGLLAIELVLLLIGTSIVGALDDVFPDLDVDHSILDRSLGFVGFGKVPSLIIIMCFTAMFGLFGILEVQAAENLLGKPLPYLLSVPVAVTAAILATSALSSVLGRLMPHVHTTAVSAQTLIGREAKVEYGTARADLPADAIVTDEYGNRHHIQLKSANVDEVFREGETAYIVRTEDGFYYATRRNGIEHIN